MIELTSIPRTGNMQHKHIPKRLYFILLLSILSNFCYADIELRFGLYTSDRPSDLVKKFRPIIKLIEQRLSIQLAQKVSINFIMAPTYSQGINQLANGEIDFMRMGPASYVLAHKQNSAIEILAVESIKGMKKFKGIICVQKNSSIQTVQDLRGHSFAFGDKHSTIGRYLSQRFLVEKGIRAKDLGKYKYFDSHDKVGAIVGLGALDAGALKASTYKKLIKKGVKLRKLAEFDNITKPWVARAKLDPTVIAALKNVLLNIKKHKALKKLKKDGFLHATHDDYKWIKIAIDKNSEFFE